MQHENFDFDSDTNKNIFSHPYINYIVNERLQGGEKFHSKNYLLEMLCHMHHKMIAKAISKRLSNILAKSYTLQSVS